MRYTLLFFLILFGFQSIGQGKRSKVPSYFGIQVSPVFPTQFIGNPVVELQEGGFSSTITQKAGYSFGATVRAGITELIAFDSGISFTQRNFDVQAAHIDSNASIQNTLSLIEYNIPLNLLFYIKLTDELYANASFGGMITYKPTDVAIVDYDNGLNKFVHRSYINGKAGFDLNASLGFEYRTKKKGFFYVGGTARVPLKPAFVILAEYSYKGYDIDLYNNVDGSFLSLDFKYFFPNIRNKGMQFRNGPIL